MSDGLLDRFDRFFAAVNPPRPDGERARPYRWQRELVASIAREGRWPEAIAMPTGAGKSSVVDVHVFLVAERALQQRGERPADAAPIARPPRRLVLVAPRRALVEDQFERATTLAGRLARARAGEQADRIVAQIAGALEGLRTTAGEADADAQDAEHDGDGRAHDGGGRGRASRAQPAASPLGVALLRGGVRLDLSWRLDPAQCQIVCATPQMWGSRLLLRGFRGSRRARNLEAGLLGRDVAVVVDEAHLHGRLIDTARRIARYGDGPLGLQLVAMSATQATGEGDVRLSERDLQDAELRRRVQATKRVTIAEVADWRREAVAKLAGEAQRLRADPATDGTVGVFVNTVPTALEVAAALDGAVEVVCSRMRPADLAQLRRDRPGLLDARGNDAVDFLVTTQSLEVGVDLDLPALVTAIAPADALAQRAGRLNRSGRRAQAELVVVAPAVSEETTADQLDRAFLPYSGRDVLDALAWLRALDGDASPQRVASTPLPPPPADPRPPLTRVELETASLAGGELSADLDAGFYVDPPVEREERTVSIGARAHLAELALPEEARDEVVGKALNAAPPRAHELAALELTGRALADVLAASRHAWSIRGDGGSSTLQVERVNDPRSLRQGDVVIVSAGSLVRTRRVIGLPGRRQSGDPIRDVIAARPEGKPDVVVALRRGMVESALRLDRTLGSRAARRELAAAVQEVDGEAARRLRNDRLVELEVRWCEADVAVDDRPDPRADGLLVLTATDRQGELPATAVRDDDEPITVEGHCDDVAKRLAHALDRLDVEPERDLGAARERLLNAARWHDLGKHHPRFQRRMGAEPGDPPLAKPRPGAAKPADRGDGWRHEQLSAAIAWLRGGRDPLPVVVLASHHGHGMPLFDRDAQALLEGWDDADQRVREAAEELFGGLGRYELERARLTQALGLHRLALLEALLRCADMQISREGR